MMLANTISSLPSFVPIPFRSRLLPSIQENSHTKHTKVDEHLSEIDGGLLANRTSVYLHLEQGLAKSPNGAAIISTHQSADHLSKLLPANRKCQKSDFHTLLNQKKHPNSFNGDSSTDELTADHVQSNCLKLSYTQVHHIAQDLALGMSASGAQPDSTILILVPNGGEFGLLLWTSIIMRLTFVCADPTAFSASYIDGLRYLLQSLKPSIVAVSSGTDARIVDSLVSDLRLARPLAICLDTTDAPKRWKSLDELAADGSESLTDIDNLLESARNDDPQRVNSVLFTSGTSGRPKGCPLRVGGITHMLHSQAWLIDKDACSLALQQVHPSRGIAPAQTLQTWRAGGAVVMTGRGFAVEDIAQAIRKHRVTFIVLTPSMIYDLAKQFEARPLNVDCVRSIQVGGDAVTKGVLTRCAALFPRARICVNHGMTEGGGSFIWPFSSTPVHQIPYFGEMCPVGMVAPGSVVRIWDTDNKRLSTRGEPGALHVCCGSVIRHYLFGASESSFYDDETGRWFDTGDIAIMNTEGVVFILGRSKDMIKRVGLAIMPAPIENCIEEYTGALTTVVAVPHPEYGHEPLAVMSSFNGKHPNEIRKHVKRLFDSRYDLCGSLSLEQLGLDEFPVNATHKIMKAEVQKAALQYLARATKAS